MHLKLIKASLYQWCNWMNNVEMKLKKLKKCTIRRYLKKKKGFSDKILNSTTAVVP